MSYFARVVSNSKSWQHPSGTAGKCAGDHNWECPCGFGFEEWYRNENFQIKEKDGRIWQYGYLQCFKNTSPYQPGIYADITLFTRKCEGKCARNAIGNWWKVAHYKEIEVLSQELREQAIQYFSASLNTMRQELVNLVVNVVECFDNQPLLHTTHGDVQPKLNFRFQLRDEDFCFDKKTRFVPRNGCYRYRNLYEH